MSLNEPFDAPVWPDLPIREGDGSEAAFIEVFMNVVKAVL
jgi:hypothetical protein